MLTSRPTPSRHADTPFATRQSPRWGALRLGVLTLGILTLCLLALPQTSASAQPASEYSESTLTNSAQSAPNETLSVGSVEYAYRRIGGEHGVPIVLLQRFRGAMDDWDPAFVNALAQRRTVIVFDNRGVAASTGEVPTSIPEAAADAATFIRSLGYDEVDVLGWSMGGFTAQVMAIEHPELVRNLVLVGTGPGGSPETSPPADSTIFEVATKPTYATADNRHIFFTDSETGSAANAASLSRIANGRVGGRAAPTSQEVMNRQAQAIQRFWIDGEGEYFSRLGDIEAPTLIVNGDRDAFFDVKGQWLLYREIPDAYMRIFPDAGHASQHQYPEEVAADIAAFIEAK